VRIAGLREPQGLCQGYVVGPVNVHNCIDDLRVQRLALGQPTWRNPSEKKGKLVWYTRSIGTELHLPDVILDRVREMAASSRQL